MCLWNVDKGTCMRTYRDETFGSNCCAWLPESKSFLCGSIDKALCHFSIDGQLLFRWPEIRKVSEISIDNVRRVAVIVYRERHVVVISLETRLILKEINERYPITSLYLSRDGRFALMNVAVEEVHLWNLESGTLTNTYVGHEQKRFLIRSCFGWADESLVLGGSENNLVYIWHRSTGKILETLRGHQKTVNSVVWNARHGGMCASASDDSTVRI